MRRPNPPKIAHSPMDSQRSPIPTALGLLLMLALAARRLKPR
jgi:MYXO-CTERM domain-containing protein